MKTSAFDVLIWCDGHGYVQHKNIIADNEEQAIKCAIGNDDFCEVIKIERKTLNFSKKVYDYEKKEYFLVDESTRKVYNYNNKNKIIKYFACAIHCEDVNREKPFKSVECDYIVNDVLTDIDERINSWNNPVKFFYAYQVGFDAPKNDPDKKIYKIISDYVKTHQEEFFTKSGDWRQRIGAGRKALELELVDNDDE